MDQSEQGRSDHEICVDAALRVINGSGGNTPEELVQAASEYLIRLFDEGGQEAQ